MMYKVGKTLREERTEECSGKGLKEEQSSLPGRIRKSNEGGGWRRLGRLESRKDTREGRRVRTISSNRSEYRSLWYTRLLRIEM